MADQGRLQSLFERTANVRTFRGRDNVPTVVGGGMVAAALFVFAGASIVGAIIFGGMAAAGRRVMTKLIDAPQAAPTQPMKASPGVALGMTAEPAVPALAAAGAPTQTPALPQARHHSGEINDYDVMADQKELDNNFALIQASLAGKTDTVKALLGAGADVHAEGDQAVCYASGNGHTETVKLLLEAGANVHAYNDAALFRASRGGHTETVEVLLEAGANVHAQGDVALRWASGRGHTAVVKLLLEAGADVHAGNDEALRFASAEGHTEIVKILEAAIASAAATETQKIFKEMGVELTQQQAVKVSVFLAARPAGAAKPQAPAP